MDMVEGPDTTHVSAMDEEGNAIAITHTLGSPCSGVVVEGLGFLFKQLDAGLPSLPGPPELDSPRKGAHHPGCLRRSCWRTASRSS